MSEHYDFHYQPTGSGAISGQQVLEQTEDAINELGDYVNDNVGGAMDVAQQALETAQNAEQDAQTALDTANSFSSAIQSAQQDASTALSTAQTAQTTATNANATAIQASQDASSAVTTANNASSQVSTLSGTVTALGQRVTTAEGNIGQNTSDITALTTRVGTAEGNITTLQNDVTIAQGNASSAMATAGTVKQQSYVLRYSSTTLVASSTNSNSLLDNTDNLKVGDKVIDASGVIYSVTAIDTANSTFTIGTALIDLANDSDVVHKSGDETISGIKSFSDDTYVKNINFTKEVASSSVSTTSILQLINTVTYTDETASKVATLNFRITADGVIAFYPNENNQYALGLQSRKWSEVRAIQYYYGSSDTEFSDKFVTTDTSQRISGVKTFTKVLTNNLQAENTSLTLQSSGTNRSCAMYNGSSAADGGGFWCYGKDSSNGSDCRLQIYNTSKSRYERVDLVNSQFLPSPSGELDCGGSSNKWKSFNGLEPSALGMPDLDNGIDISSYITVVANANKESLYTPPANGWISVRLSRTSGALGVLLIQGNMASSGKNIEVESGVTTADAMLPVVGGVQVSINSALADGIVSAYFYPCQGNV
jgi:hypothetical protein